MEIETAPPPAPSGGIDTLLKVLNRLETVIAMTAFTLMLLDVLAGVVMRYILQVPFPWGEEAARYLMVIGTLGGIGIGVKESAHLNVELFRSWLPSASRRVVTLIADFVTLSAFGFLIYLSYVFITLNKRFGQRTAALDIPIYYVYCILLVGFIIAFLEHLVIMHRRNQNGTAQKEGDA